MQIIPMKLAGISGKTGKVVREIHLDINWDISDCVKQTVEMMQRDNPEIVRVIVDIALNPIR